MTQTSYFWTHPTIGDGTLQPYSSDEWCDIFKVLFIQDNTLANVTLRYGNELAVTNPSGTTVRVGSGIALVDGTLYENTANVDLVLTAPANPNTNYYTIILRKSWAGKTVVVANLGPVLNGPYPTPTQTDGVTWEVALAQVTVTWAGVVYIVTDQRAWLRTGGAGYVSCSRRYGNADDWHTHVDYDVDANYRDVTAQSKMQCGCTRWTGGAVGQATHTVYYPVAYPEGGQNTFGFATVVMGASADYTLSVLCYYDRMEISWRNVVGGTATSLDFFWFVIGEKDYGFV